MKNFSKKVSLAGLSVVVVSTMLLGTSAMAADWKLESTKVSAPISMDVSDGAWAKAKEVIVPLTETPYKPDGYKGILKTNVSNRVNSSEKIL